MPLISTRRTLLRLFALAALGGCFASTQANALPTTHTRTEGESAVKSVQEPIRGMYVHQHWGYKRPYSARTWTLKDWEGYVDGLQKMGYNTILYWGMLETMPDPLTPSDEASLQKMSKVIDMVHSKGMRIYLCLCPNIIADNEVASKSSFETRHYYYCDVLVNPGDPVALQKMISWREKLIRPLAKLDGISIIDSDPGCYPHSTNQEFVNLLLEHRKMFDRVRPGIELIYWMHAGWRGWSRFYETGKLLLGTAEEQEDTLRRLKAANPEPWGLANGLAFAQKLGEERRVIGFNYGRIEGEPSFPMTNFTGQNAYEGGAAPTARGVMGNAQTHCVQLPNTFAFIRGALGKPIGDADYIQFANDLVTGHGEAILAGWKAMGSLDAATIAKAADALEAISKKPLRGGNLKGLLFGSPKRFVTDLVKMLRLRAATEALSAVIDAKGDTPAALKSLIDAASVWQKTHAYQNNWGDVRLLNTLAKIKTPAFKEAFAIRYEAEPPFDPGVTTAAEQVHRNFAKIETYTPTLLKLMRQALQEIAKK